MMRMEGGEEEGGGEEVNERISEVEEVRIVVRVGRRGVRRRE
jgi:translation elongation factor EF-1beta